MSVTATPVQPKPDCPHNRTTAGHCCVMDCGRYISKCPVHGPVTTGDKCNLATPAVPFKVPVVKGK